MLPLCTVNMNWGKLTRVCIYLYNLLFDSFGEFIQQACASLASLDFGNFSASLDFAWKQFKTFWICFWKFHWTVFWHCLCTFLWLWFENVFEQSFEKYLKTCFKNCLKFVRKPSKRFQNVSKHFETMLENFQTLRSEQFTIARPVNNSWNS